MTVSMQSDAHTERIRLAVLVVTGSVFATVWTVSATQQN